MKDILRRIQRAVAEVEARQSTQFPVDDERARLGRLMRFLVSVHIGRLGPRESPMEGYARALGYDRPRDFEAALKRPDLSDVQERHAAAVDRLFAAAGVDLATAAGDAVTNGVMKMVRAVPPPLRSRLPEGCHE